MRMKTSKAAKELTLENEIVPAEETALQTIPVTPMQMLQTAVDQNYDTDKLEMLMTLQERYEANEAKKAFDKAMSGFRGESIKIIKRKKAGFDHKSGGGRTEYSFADLADAVDAAVPALGKWGLSHDWDTNQNDGGLIIVTCTLTHEQGHSKQTSLQASPDTTGSKNNLQAIGSTISYLERYTFLAITGLAAKGMDDDAKTAETLKTINEKQVADLESLITEVGSDKAAFMKYCKVDNLGEILVQNYHFAVQALEAKRKA